MPRFCTIPDGGRWRGTVEEERPISPVALALVLLAAGFHAGWNRALHGTPDRVAAMAVAGLASGLVLLPAILLAPPHGVALLIVLSALAETAYALCLSAAYRRGALTLAYPIGRGTAPLLVTLGGWVVLAQRPTPESVAAACCLVSGLVLVATAGRGHTKLASIGFAVLTGVCIASYSLIDARAVQHAFPISYLGAVMAVQGLLLAVWVRVETRSQGGWGARLGKVWRPGLLIAIGSLAAYLLVLFAFQRAGAGRVATLREVSVLLGILLAREKSGPRVWLGAALVVAGAVLAAA